MKQIVMFVQQSCPYCRQALKWQNELIEKYPELAALEINIVDELREPQLADSYDYYYVPTYFVGGHKAHEGAATEQKVEQVLRSALED